MSSKYEAKTSSAEDTILNYLMSLYFTAFMVGPKVIMEPIPGYLMHTHIIVYEKCLTIVSLNALQALYFSTSFRFTRNLPSGSIKFRFILKDDSFQIIQHLFSMILTL